MKLRLLNSLGVMSLLFGFYAPAAIESGAQIGSPKRGLLSEVRLLAVSHLPPHALTSTRGAQDGLRLVFLVTSRLDVDGELTLREMRDFKVDGRNYSERSVIGRSAAPEPNTYVLNPEDLVKLDASTRGLVPSGSTKAAGIVVDIAGATLPPRGICQVVLQVGWNDRVEDFVFDFDLGKVPTETPYNRYRGSL